MIIAEQTEQIFTPPLSIKLCIMISTPILLATLASLLTLGSAAPVPNNDGHPSSGNDGGIIIIEEPTTQGRPINWLTPDGQELCLQVNPTQFKTNPADQLYNGALLGM